VCALNGNVAEYGAIAAFADMSVDLQLDRIQALYIAKSCIILPLFFKKVVKTKVSPSGMIGVLEQLTSSRMLALNFFLL
jgi:hypothetical protein